MSKSWYFTIVPKRKTTFSPYAPCLVYLPTFEWFVLQMFVNIPAPRSIWAAVRSLKTKFSNSRLLWKSFTIQTLPTWPLAGLPRWDGPEKAKKIGPFGEKGLKPGKLAWIRGKSPGIGKENPRGTLEFCNLLVVSPWYSPPSKQLQPPPCSRAHHFSRRILVCGYHRGPPSYPLVN